MDSVNNMTKAELDLYCGLLPFAYKIEQERTGLVCGTVAESLRDRMYASMQPLLNENI